MKTASAAHIYLLMWWASTINNNNQQQQQQQQTQAENWFPFKSKIWWNANARFKSYAKWMFAAMTLRKINKNFICDCNKFMITMYIIHLSYSLPQSFAIRFPYTRSNNKKKKHFKPILWNENKCDELKQKMSHFFFLGADLKNEKCKEKDKENPTVPLSSRSVRFGDSERVQMKHIYTKITARK